MTKEEMIWQIVTALVTTLSVLFARKQIKENGEKRRVRRQTRSANVQRTIQRKHRNI